MPKTKNLPTEADILRAYQAEQEFQTDTAFADALLVTRGKMSNWLNHVHYPDLPWLLQTARLFAGKWQSDLAVDILRRRGNEDDIPCVCTDAIGDNGPCPKHSDPTPSPSPKSSHPAGTSISERGVKVQS